MGGSLVLRLVQRFPSLSVSIVEPSSAAHKRLLKRLQDFYTPTNETLHWWGSISDIDWSLSNFTKKRVLALLCIKPQDFESVCSSMPSFSEKIAGVLSIMAGVPIVRLQEGTAIQCVARAMPNIAAQYSSAVVGLSFSAHAPARFRTESEALLQPMGWVYQLPEEQLHTITALSGSGIAFVLEYIRHLARCGVAMGLERDIAHEIVVHTVQGAVALLTEENTDPQEWIARICSPGGTTVAGMQALERGNFGAVVVQALHAVARRSRELGAP